MDKTHIDKIIRVAVSDALIKEAVAEFEFAVKILKRKIEDGKQYNIRQHVDNAMQLLDKRAEILEKMENAE